LAILAVLVLITVFHLRGQDFSEYDSPPGIERQLDWPVGDN